MKPFWIIFAVITAIIGYEVNQGSVFWAVINFFFWPISWVKWLICHDVTLSIIKNSFAFFFA
jgi:uncharacterized membrane protein